MSNIFYYGSDNKVYGPVTEQEAQGWYTCGYLSSDVRFQISKSDRFDSKGSIFKLGELIEKNGRALPFFFPQETENREKAQEEKMKQMMQEIKSLRTIQKEMQDKAKDRGDVVKLEAQIKSLVEEIESLRRIQKENQFKDRGDVIKLEAQVASLVESQADLLRRLNVISNQKESSPIAPQLEKKVNEMKKRVDEQEKNFASMKKELSAVTSKCDRNDAKLDKLLASQKAVEGAVNGYDSRIAELKDNEKSIRDSLNECEQNVASSSTQLESITNDLSEIKREVEQQRKETLANKSELDSVRMSEESLRKEIETVKEAADKSIQIVKSAEHVDDSPSETDDLPPWEKEEITVGVEMAKKEDSNEEKKTESAPWDENQGLPGSNDEDAPWSDENDSVKKDVVDRNKKEEGKVEKKKKENAKPVPRVKDWDAICRDLSDEEEEPAIPPEAVPVPIQPFRDGDFVIDGLSVVGPPGCAEAMAKDMAKQSATKFIRDSVSLLRKYCEALENDFKSLRPADHKIAMMDRYQATICPKSESYSAIREALLAEMRRLTSVPLKCGACKFPITTPRHLLFHLTDIKHGPYSKLPEQFAEAWIIMTDIVLTILYKFIAAPSEIDKATGLEAKLLAKGRRLANLHRNSEKTLLRPTPEFIIRIQQMADGIPCGSATDSDKIAACEVLCELFAKEENISGLDEEMRAHLAEGIPICFYCNVAYDNAEEYFQHMTTYAHAIQDPTTFAFYIIMWKGRKYWDAMLLNQPSGH